MSTLGKTLEDLKAKVAATTATMATELAKVREAITAKRKELDVARSAPVPPAELEARLVAWFDAHVAASERELGDVAGRFGNPTTRPNVHGPLAEHLLLLLGAPALRKEIPRLVQALSYRAGPAAADRPRRVAQLEGELAALELQEEQFVDDLLAAGLQAAHRPEVITRRREEADERRRDEAAAAARKPQEDRVNSQHEAAVGRSQYLAAAQAERQAVRGT